MLAKIYLVLSILLGACGQVMFKLGIDKTHKENLQFYLELMLNKWIILGFFSYGVSFLLWMRVLKFYDVSFARSFTSIGYIVTYILAIFLLGEELTIRRLMAIALITGGVFLLK
ncbi:MAG: DMT family transporter [Bacillota bacterium]